MEDLLKIAGAAVAVVASLAAVALAVEQLTLRSRLRKTETWATAQLETEESAERIAVLKRLQLEATARIVAGLDVPVRLFADGALTAVGVTVAIAAMMQDDEVGTRSLVSLVGVALLGLVLSARRAVRVYLERCRIASAYARSLAVTPARLGLLDLMEGGTRIEFAYAAAVAAFLGSFSVGLGLALSGRSVDGLPLLLLLTGAMGAVQTLDVLRTHARRLSPLRD